MYYMRKINLYVVVVLGRVISKFLNIPIWNVMKGRDGGTGVSRSEISVKELEISM